MKSWIVRRAFAAALGFCLAVAAFGQPGSGPAGKLELKKIDPVRSYRPVAVALAAAKPAEVKKAPEIQANLKFGTIRLGNGPAAATLVAVLDDKDASKIFIDKNRNGDLTDDGDGAWNKKGGTPERVVFGPLEVALRASYGTAEKETSTADTILHVYFFPGRDMLFTYSGSCRTGTVAIGGKPFAVTLIEDGACGLYNRPVSSAEEAAKSAPVRLDGTWKGGDGSSQTLSADIRAPFKVGDKVYAAEVSDDGALLKIEPTDKPALDLRPKAPVRPPLLAAGTMAPDFTAEKWGGGALKLSDYRGQAVILDFWSTWCGPCQRSMPHVQKVYESVKDKGVAVIGVCVWDTKEAYEAWIPKNKEKYTFQFAFDPAGRGADNIAKKLFNVSGIPTTYVIDKDGKVAGAIVGYSDGDRRIEETLKKLGVE